MLNLDDSTLSAVISNAKHLRTRMRGGWRQSTAPASSWRRTLH